MFLLVAVLVVELHSRVIEPICSGYVPFHLKLVSQQLFDFSVRWVSFRDLFLRIGSRKSGRGFVRTKKFHTKNPGPLLNWTIIKWSRILQSECLSSRIAGPGNLLDYISKILFYFSKLPLLASLCVFLFWYTVLTFQFSSVCTVFKWEICSWDYLFSCVILRDRSHIF